MKIIIIVFIVAILVIIVGFIIADFFIGRNQANNFLREHEQRMEDFEKERVRDNERIQREIRYDERYVEDIRFYLKNYPGILNDDSQENEPK